jgi:hypothetical protein
LKQRGSIIEKRREESREKRGGRKETRSIAGFEVYNGFREVDISHRQDQRNFRCSFFGIDPIKKGLIYSVLGWFLAKKCPKI